jgi:hypothetical protein
MEEITDSGEIVSYPWMCEPCFPDCVEIAELAQGLSLIYNKKEDYCALLGGQGHKGDELIVFEKGKHPWPDPCPEMMDDDLYRSFKPTPEQAIAISKWDNTIDNLMWVFDAPTGHWLVEQTKLFGYGANPTKEHGRWEAWVYNHVGKIIEKYIEEHKGGLQ